MGWLGEADFAPLDGRMAAVLAPTLARHADRYAFDTGRSEIAARALPFYAGTQLVRVRPNAGERDLAQPAAEMPGLVLWYLVHGEMCQRLDGTLAAIERLNEAGRLVLNRETALDYLRFFAFFVRAGDGPFQLVETAQDLAEVLAEPLDPTQPAALPRRLRLEGSLADGSMVAAGTVAYDRALFPARFAIAPDGQVKLLDEEPATVGGPGRA